MFLASFNKLFAMAGHQNSRLFLLNSAVVLQNKDAVGKGIIAIQQFFRGNILKPLGADIYSLFVFGAMGFAKFLSVVQTENTFPCFQPERWEEITYLW
jgi:hypothetical protein